MAMIPTSVSTGDIRAVLAINTMEAQTGTTRTLTLPGGRRVTVPVPAGVRDGQIVRLAGEGEVSSAGGPPGALILTLLVKAAEEPPPMAEAGATGAEDTVLTPHQAAPATSVPTVSNMGKQPMVSNAVHPEVNTPPSPLLEPMEAIPPASQASLPTQTVISPRIATTPFYDSSGSSLSSSELASSIEPQPSQRGISRLVVVLGVAGLAAASAAGIAWLVVSHPSSQPAGNTSTSTPTPPPPPATPTPTTPTTPTPPTLSTPLFTYTGHSNIVSAVAWSPNGKRIASASSDKTVQVWSTV